MGIHSTPGSNKYWIWWFPLPLVWECLISFNIFPLEVRTECHDRERPARTFTRVDLADVSEKVRWMRTHPSNFLSHHISFEAIFLWFSD